MDDQSMALGKTGGTVPGTTATRAKFKLEFFLLMRMAGRMDDARDAVQGCMDLLDQLISEGH